MIDLDNFVALKLSLCSPDTIRAWSYGEVKKPETINYRTQKPERDGLFCERIFGPTKDWECFCGKYKRERFKGIVCDRCGVEVTRSKVRRERMGHIELATPVSHIWFFKGIPSRISLMVDLPPREVEKVLYYASYIVVEIDKDYRKTKKEEIEKAVEKKLAELIKDKEETIEKLNEKLTRKTKQLEKEPQNKELQQEIEKIEKEIEGKKLRTEESEKIIKEGLNLLFRMEEKDLIDEEQYRALTTVKNILEEKKIITERKKLYEIGMGAEAIKKILEKINLEKLVKQLRKELKTAPQQQLPKIIKRLEVAEAFYKSGTRPEWMILEVLPVIPPDLRPMVQISGGRYASSDLNDLYRRVINRNNRLKRLMELGTPDVIIRNEKRMIQEAVDALLDNSKRARPVLGSTGRALKSLSDLLRGKQGRFRQNLLGKRVDYSGRSVIVVGPHLKLYQCGLPKEMSLELFKPFVMKRLVDKGYVHNVKSAKRMIERMRPEVWDVLEEIIRDHPILLNRAPTLHRLGIQAFEPILVEGKAIQIHPLVCVPFNADFDGDQMAAHVPLSLPAQLEARLIMLSAYNLLSPASGKPIVNPTQDMVLGCYYLTKENLEENDIVKAIPYKDLLLDEIVAHDVINPETKEVIISQNNRITPEVLKKIIASDIKQVKIYHKKYFTSVEEVLLAKEVNSVKLHTAIKLGLPAHSKIKVIEDTQEVIVASTLEEVKEELVGKLLLEDVIHPLNGKVISHHGERITDRMITLMQQARVKMLKVAEDATSLPTVYKFGYIETTVGRCIFNQIIPKEIGFINKCMNKDTIAQLVNKAYTQLGIRDTVILLDELKDIGFKHATEGGLSIGINDMVIPKEKEEILRATDEAINKIELLTKQKLMTEEERYWKVVDKWSQATDVLTEKLLAHFHPLNPLFMMVDSGARGAIQQLRQLSGMRGLAIDPAGKIIDLPIKASFREGLTVLEYFISTHGARKGLADTALRTADAGYLTRRLVDVVQDIVIREYNCKTTTGIYVKAMYDGEEMIKSLKDRILLRVAAEDIIHPKTNQIIVGKDEVITDEIADKIEAAGIEEVKIRSLLTCKSKQGLCVLCYGINLATGRLVDKGEAVGIIAAQSIGEPGTQLTLRTFHTGGMHGGDVADITQGLPRVEELFEARRPKGEAIISEIEGEVKIVEENNRIKIRVIGEKDKREYEVLPGIRIKVTTGKKVAAGEQLTDGSINPHTLLRIKGVLYTQQHLVEEIQKVYHAQGVEINDKHIELIIRQLFRKVKIEDPGDTEFLPGQLVDMHTFEEENKKMRRENKKSAKGRKIFLGVTKSSLATGSFLSAASFQETTRVLADATVQAKKDDLLGLKENIIIGKLIPAGTGMDIYREIRVEEEKRVEGE